MPQGDNGETVDWQAVERKLLEIIEAEDKRNPLSDEDLVAKLGDAGYRVARRVVTKYRKDRRIPSAEQRKIWTA